MTFEWKALLGKTLRELESIETVNSHINLSSPSDIKTYVSDVYYCFYPQGIALSFSKSNQKLTGIDLYNKDSRYGRVNEKLLPESITHTTTGKQFVQLFGEPEEKGGPPMINAYLRWSGIEVNLQSRNWDLAADDIWASLTIFDS
jgi:hypothetical protein